MLGQIWTCSVPVLAWPHATAPPWRDFFPKRGQRPEHSFPWEGSEPLQACSQHQGSVVPVPSAAWLSPTPASLAGSSSVPPESCVAGEGRVGRSGGLIPSPPRAVLPRGAVPLTWLHHGGGTQWRQGLLAGSMGLRACRQCSPAQLLVGSQVLFAASGQPGPKFPAWICCRSTADSQCSLWQACSPPDLPSPP